MEKKRSFLSRLFFQDPVPKVAAPVAQQPVPVPPVVPAPAQAEPSPFCNSCGTKNETRAPFCTNCGNKLV